MLPELQPTANAFAVADRFMSNLTKDLAPADWQVQDAAGHDPRWVVGHIATYRRKVLGMVGLPQEPAAWEDQFTRGKSAADLRPDLDMEVVLAAFHACQPLLASRWDALTPEALAAPFGRTLPNGLDTVGGAIQFMAWHEAYHMGQLGLLRRLGGKPGLA